MLTYKEFDSSYLNQYIRLWHRCFGYHTTSEQVTGKITGVAGSAWKPVTLLAIHEEKDQVVGAASGYPLFLRYRSEPAAVAMQIGDAIVDPEFRKLGVFSQLSSGLISLGMDKGYRFMVSFPAYAKPGSYKAMTNAGLTEVAGMTRFEWKVPGSPLVMRIARKLGDGVYTRMVQAKLPRFRFSKAEIRDRFYTSDEADLAVPFSETYLQLKNVADKVHMQIPGAGAILALERFSVNIGMYYAETDRALAQLLKRITDLARSLGKDTVYYATSIKNETDQLNRYSLSERRPEGAILFRDLMHKGAPEVVTCSMRMFDLDTFL